MQKNKKTKKRVQQKDAAKRIEKIKHIIPDHTYEYLMAKTGLAYHVIWKYCKQHGLKTKRKKRNKSLHELTSKKLKKLSQIDSSKKTKKELAVILRTKNNPLSRQACNLFLRKHNIKFKQASKNTITKTRLDKLNKISSKKLKKMDILDIVELLEFKGDHARANTTRFLRQNKIEYK